MIYLMEIEISKKTIKSDWWLNLLANISARQIS